MMIARLSLDDLWKSAPSSERTFDSAKVRGRPEGARHYLEHAIAAGTPLASAVRLYMHGEIRLRGWYPFSSEQVIRWDRGMIWRAAVRMYGISIHGGDSFLDGQGAMRWKLFGIVPVINASGPDITRSSAGRVHIESISLPSVPCCDGVSWTAVNRSHIHAGFTAHDQAAEVDYLIDDKGGLKSVNMPRWGNPEGAEFHYANCGGFVEKEATFDGHTIPTRMRVGWYFGTEGFGSAGGFFRVTIDHAAYTGLESAGFDRCAISWFASRPGRKSSTP